MSLNSRFEAYYQRKLVPVTSSTYTHSPTLFMGASRALINNHIGRFKGDADSVYYDDIPSLGFENVLHNLHQELIVADKYTHEFRNYNIGVHIPLMPRHALTVNAGFRQYYETLKRLEEINDHSSFIKDGTDITGEIPGAGETFVDDMRFFTDLEYFRSSEFSLEYSYFNQEPATVILLKAIFSRLVLQRW